jgi:hypothetical protein
MIQLPPYRTAFVGVPQKETDRMKLSKGDTVQLIVTVGGVPYAKTWTLKSAQDIVTFPMLTRRMGLELFNDIENYANEGTEQ